MYCYHYVVTSWIRGFLAEGGLEGTDILSVNSRDLNEVLEQQNLKKGDQDKPNL